MEDEKGGGGGGASALALHQAQLPSSSAVRGNGDCGLRQPRYLAEQTGGGASALALHLPSSSPSSPSSSSFAATPPPSKDHLSECLVLELFFEVIIQWAVVVFRPAWVIVVCVFS